MTIGIIAAMDEEIAYLKDVIINPKEVEVANTLFIEGEIENQHIILLKSGIGKVNAAMATTILIERYQPDRIINTGSAGGISEELEIGDLVISSAVVHHDVDATAFNYKYGQVPGMPENYPADEILIERTKSILNDLKINSAIGVIGTGDSFINDPKRVEQIIQRIPDLIAAEMEAAAIAQVCYQYSVPFVVLRALSDVAGKESNISFNEFLSLAAKNSSKLIVELLRTFSLTGQ